MERFLIWGTGSLALNRYDLYVKMEISKSAEIVGFIDNNSKMWGNAVRNLPVYGPDDIKKINFDYVAIWSTYKDEIKKQLTEDLNIPHSKIKNIFTPYIEKLKEKYIQSSTEEIQTVINRIEQSGYLSVYNFEPQSEEKIYEAVYDEKANLHYVWFEGKKLYLKRNYPFVNKAGKKYVKDLWYEQDVNSPHLYEEGEVSVESGDVLVDAGACEGNFSLHNIDKVKKVYLIECDDEWVEALTYTFEPYKDKVVFCNKFLSDKDTDFMITLDSLVSETVDFIKMDIEGEERNALKGARKLLEKSDAVKCAICTYHKHDDETIIKEMLEELNFKTSVSKGYMLFLYDDKVLKEPELRRGIIRGVKR